jgi:hypothetical protein
MTLNDPERQAIRAFSRYSLISRSSIATFIMNCRITSNLHNMTDEQYADTVRKSTKAFIELVAAVDYELRGLGL